MAKKRRTRKDKVRADLRHHHLAKSRDSEAIAIPQEKEEPLEKTEKRNSIFQFTAAPAKAKKEERAINPLSTDYAFLRHDLRKTGILTLSIILAQVGLYFLIRSIT